MILRSHLILFLSCVGCLFGILETGQPLENVNVCETWNLEMMLNWFNLNLIWKSNRLLEFPSIILKHLMPNGNNYSDCESNSCIEIFFKFKINVETPDLKILRETLKIAHTPWRKLICCASRLKLRRKWKWNATLKMGWKLLETLKRKTWKMGGILLLKCCASKLTTSTGETLSIFMICRFWTDVVLKWLFENWLT